MKKPIIVGNWKANKNLDQVQDWLGEFVPNCPKGELKVEVAVAPAFPYLIILQHFFRENNLRIKLCAQDISPYPEGTYTGAVAGTMLVGLAEYVLIGHSERRKYFGEDDSQAAQKAQIAINLKITPIICISEMKQFNNILKKLKDSDLKEAVFMFEPPKAISVQTGPIGKGKAEPVEEVVKMTKEMKKLSPESRFFYGGSVKSDNIASFCSQPEIDGVVPGTASQNAQEFVRMIKNAA